jgi:hypothetical protein
MVTKIYESPDKGATIYERNPGELKRELVKENTSYFEKLKEDKMWGEIRRLAHTNPAMKEYTDRCVELYHLLKEANE